MSRHQSCRAQKHNPLTAPGEGIVYSRPEDKQIDAWEEIGDLNWSWNAFFSYYKESERLQVPTERQLLDGGSFIPSAHGFDGPLDVGWPNGLLNDALH